MTSNCFFFHTGILVFLRCDSFSSYYTSFCGLSIAVRLLSDAFYTEESLEKSEALIKLFFFKFCRTLRRRRAIIQFPHNEAFS